MAAIFKMAAKMHRNINNFISQKLLCRSWWNLVQIFIGRSGRILCKKIPIGLRSWAAILKNVARKWRKISKLSELNETQYLGYFGDGEQDEAIKMAAISMWPPRATSAIARNCNSSYVAPTCRERHIVFLPFLCYYYYCLLFFFFFFFQWILSALDLRDGWTDLNETSQ